MRIKTVITLFSLLVSGGLFAQNSQHNPEEKVNTSIVYTMDSVLNEFHYRQHIAEKTDTLKLNKYNYRSVDVPVFSPVEIKKRLKEIPSVIPLAYNSKVQAFVDVYGSRLRKLTSKMLGLQKVYFPIIEEIFDKEGLPDELKYVAAIESALNPKAQSPAKAVGLWQFIHGTGKMYKMRMDSYVDERYDPVKSTYAAAHYLKDLHKIYNDWLLAIAAYNCGPGRVNYAIRRSGGNTNFWDIYKYLPSETASYVPAFIGCMYVMKHPAEHNLYPVWADFTYNQDTIHVTGMKVSLDEMAAVSFSEKELLRNLNPELKLGMIPYSSKPYVLRVPTKTAEYFRTSGFAMLKKYDTRDLEPTQADFAKSPVANNNSSKKTIYHKVAKGESPEVIAQKYKVSETDIRKWNFIRGPWLYAGQSLRILVDNLPENTNVASADKTTVQQPQNNSFGTQPSSDIKRILYYRVQSGDTLWTIANKHKINTIDKILAENNLRKNSVLQVGQVIKIIQ